MPIPKKGWVIQNGCPTKVDDNTARPEFIWVEARRNMSKKKQQDAMEHWAVLKPRVVEAKKERDLDPTQKSNQQFRGTMNKG